MSKNLAFPKSDEILLLGSPFGRAVSEADWEGLRRTKERQRSSFPALIQKIFVGNGRAVPFLCCFAQSDYFAVGDGFPVPYGSAGGETPPLRAYVRENSLLFVQLFVDIIGILPYFPVIRSVYTMYGVAYLRLPCVKGAVSA